MKSLLVLMSLAVGSWAFALEAEIFIQKHLQGGDIIYLKNELKQQGYRPQNFKIKSVDVIARGRGPLTLHVGGTDADTQGLNRDGIERRNGFMKVSLYSRNAGRRLNQDGVWQIHLNRPNSQMFVRKVVINMVRRPMDCTNGRDHRETWTEYGPVRSEKRSCKKRMRGRNVPGTQVFKIQKIDYMQCFRAQVQTLRSEQKTVAVLNCIPKKRKCSNGKPHGAKWTDKKKKTKKIDCRVRQGRRMVDGTKKVTVRVTKKQKCFYGFTETLKRESKKLSETRCVPKRR